MEGRGRASEHDPKTKLRRAFRGLSALRPFIELFQQTCQACAELMRLLKNEGLNQETYRRAKELLANLPERSRVRRRLDVWLDVHLRIQCRMAMGQDALVVSSDIIESVFGKFKMTIQRCPTAELNRLALVLPALCGGLDGGEVQNALNATSDIDEEKIRELATLKFIDQNQIALFLGAQGVGKTHLALAIGVLAVQDGRRVFCTSAKRLAQEIMLGRLRNNLDQLFKRLLSAHLWIIDDWGVVSMNREVAEEVFYLMDRRKHSSAMILTRRERMGRGVPGPDHRKRHRRPHL